MNKRTRSQLNTKGDTHIMYEYTTRGTVTHYVEKSKLCAYTTDSRSCSIMPLVDMSGNKYCAAHAVEGLKNIINTERVKSDQLSKELNIATSNNETLQKRIDELETSIYKIQCANLILDIQLENCKDCDHCTMGIK